MGQLIREFFFETGVVGQEIRGSGIRYGITPVPPCVRGDDTGENLYIGSGRRYNDTGVGAGDTGENLYMGSGRRYYDTGVGAGDTGEN